MRLTVVSAAALACLLLAVGGWAGGPGDRDVEALARRVSNLEKQVADMKRATEQMEKALSSLTRSSGTTNKDLERQVNQLAKAVAEIEKAASRGQGAAGGLEKELKALAARLDARTEQLAQWFDDYHARRHDGRYHRREITRWR